MKKVSKGLTFTLSVLVTVILYTGVAYPHGHYGNTNVSVTPTIVGQGGTITVSFDFTTIHIHGYFLYPYTEPWEVRLDGTPEERDGLLLAYGEEFHPPMENEFTHHVRTSAIIPVDTNLGKHTIKIVSSSCKGWPLPNYWEIYHYHYNRYSYVTIEVNNPPVADAGLDQEEVEANIIGGAYVTLDGSASYDPDGADLIYQWSWDGGSAEGVNPTVFLPVGTTTVTLVVNDGGVDSAPDDVNITVVDTTPPEMSLNAPNPSTLWPPNHKFVDVHITGTALDICDLVLGVDVSVEVIDSEGGDGGSQHDPDYEIIDATIDWLDGSIDILIALRAEHSGKGDGRIYKIIVTATDDSDNWTTEAVQVLVPHDKGKEKK